MRRFDDLAPADVHGDVIPGLAKYTRSPGWSCDIEMWAVEAYWAPLKWGSPTPAWPHAQLVSPEQSNAARPGRAPHVRAPPAGFRLPGRRQPRLIRPEGGGPISGWDEPVVPADAPPTADAADAVRRAESSWPQLPPGGPVRPGRRVPQRCGLGGLGLGDEGGDVAFDLVQIALESALRCGSRVAGASTLAAEPRTAFGRLRSWPSLRVPARGEAELVERV